METRSGAYVVKSLAGVNNKLKDVSTNTETSSLLVRWVGSIVADTSLPNHATLVKDLGSQFTSTTP